MSLGALLRIGWLVLAADFFYWWLGGAGQFDEQSVSFWHGVLNVVLSYGGALLFVVLLVLSYLLWRVNEREHTRA